MKLKILSVFLALGMFVLGAGVKATQKAEPDISGVTDPRALDVVNYIKSDEFGLSPLAIAGCLMLNKLGTKCTACDSKTSVTVAQVSACVAADKKNAAALGQICDAVCGSNSCIRTLGGQTTAQACTLVCCPWDSTYPDVQQCLAAANKKWPKVFPSATCPAPTK